MQSSLLHTHLDPTVRSPKIKRTAAKRVGGIRGRSVTVASHRWRLQAQTRGPNPSRRESNVGRRRDEARDECYVLRLPILHVTNSHFRNVVNHQTYCLVNKSQGYNGKLAARTGKYVKEVESVMKPCIFHEHNPITILRFLGRFKRSCSSNKISQKMSSWVLLNS